MADFKSLKNSIDPHKEPTKQFFLDLLDADKQWSCEQEHVSAVMQMLKVLYIGRLKAKIFAVRAEKEQIMNEGEYTAEKYKRVLEINAEIAVKGKDRGI